MSRGAGRWRLGGPIGNVRRDETGQSPVYRYQFDRKIPVAPGTKINGKPATAEDIGARQAGEIEYVFGALDSVPDVSWPAGDRELSDLMMSYWSNFAKTGDPNGRACRPGPATSPAPAPWSCTWTSRVAPGP